LLPESDYCSRLLSQFSIRAEVSPLGSKSKFLYLFSALASLVLRDLLIKLMNFSSRVRYRSASTSSVLATDFHCPCFISHARSAEHAARPDFHHPSSTLPSVLLSPLQGHRLMPRETVHPARTHFLLSRFQSPGQSALAGSPRCSAFGAIWFSCVRPRLVAGSSIQSQRQSCRSILHL
jgi:hypothetical protein